ncbi:hypothetical protein [Nitrosomonas supralitoralis]|uniref:hypothetical protein n=1 Tax=Nitrosomonas supralitoralis TaxID=2116706 RepID=UPI001F5B0EAB|nr:hypothetical protein [Nitrosomonas supralitoralis]
MATAKGLSALYAAVVVGKPITSEVLSLKMLGEYQKGMNIAHFLLGLRVAVDPDNVLALGYLHTGAGCFCHC